MSEEKLEAGARGGQGEGRQVVVHLCRVTGDGGLNVRTQPNSKSHVLFNVPTGTVLNYFEKVHGELINHNDCWAHSVEDHYYWLGGTDSPWC